VRILVGVPIAVNIREAVAPLGVSAAHHPEMRLVDFALRCGARVLPLVISAKTFAGVAGVAAGVGNEPCTASTLSRARVMVHVVAAVPSRKALARGGGGGRHCHIISRVVLVISLSSGVVLGVRVLGTAAWEGLVPRRANSRHHAAANSHPGRRVLLDVLAAVNTRQIVTGVRGVGMG